jgi:chromosomal replication initiation ATPase DnaA
VTAAQLPLELGHRPALGREDFLVVPANERAVAWLDRWPDWPGHGLVLHGPSGCGKTHLAHVWRAVSGAELIAARALCDADVARFAGTRGGEPAAAVVEDADGGVDERALLALYNILATHGAGVLLTARRPPAAWPIDLPDLRSRVAALPTTAVAAPDDQTFAAVLVKLFADRQLRVGADVIAYLATHLERTFQAAREATAALDAAALAARRNITVPLARAVLAQTPTENRPPWT